MQGPRVVKNGDAGMCRVAWLAKDDTLLRIEASIKALEPMLLENDDDTMVGFYPPSLGSFRCDVMEKIRDQENISMLVQEESDSLGPSDKSDKAPSDDDDSGLQAVRDALSM